jgi:hypothetical protein
LFLGNWREQGSGSHCWLHVKVTCGSLPALQDGINQSPGGCGQALTVLTIPQVILIYRRIEHGIQTWDCRRESKKPCFMAGVWGLWRAREMARADITFLRTGKTGY